MWFSRETCSEQKLSFVKLHDFSFQYVTLHGKTGIKVIARSQHASTLKQKNSALARLKRVQEHTSLVSSFVSLNTRRTKQRAHTDNVVKQRSVFNFKNKRYSARTPFSV